MPSNLEDLMQPVSSALLALSPLGRQQRLSILIYHRILKDRDWMRPDEPTAEEFDLQMQILKRHFNVLPLREAVHKLKNGDLPKRTACITFDDGYADNLTVAQPILKRHGLPATVFVATGYLDGGRMWNDTVVESLRHHTGDELDLSRLNLPAYPTGDRSLRREAAYDIIRRCKYMETGRREEIAESIALQAASKYDSLMLTTEQLLTLYREGVEIGGHTESHPILSRVPLEQARQEIIQCKAKLQDIINKPLRLFAYPNGHPDKDFTRDHVAMVKQAGFEAAVTNQFGVSSARSDFFQLPRFTPWDKTSSRFLLRMGLNSRHVAEAQGKA
jgi:peptidoglycan/xylan/chitin deacetylase (PgdA/CDA1 family)